MLCISKMNQEEMKSVDETNELLRKLNEDWVLNDFNITKVRKQLNTIKTSLRLLEEVKKELTKQIKQLEFANESKNMFESVKQMEGFDTLLPEELLKIASGMDKRDYSSVDKQFPRYYDLERIIKEAIILKQQQPDWTLDDVKITGQYDTYPPRSFYDFTYKTPHGRYMHCSI